MRGSHHDIRWMGCDRNASREDLDWYYRNGGVVTKRSTSIFSGLSPQIRRSSGVVKLSKASIGPNPAPQIFKTDIFVITGSATVLKIEICLLRGQPPYSKLRFLYYGVSCRIQNSYFFSSLSAAVLKIRISLPQGQLPYSKLIFLSYRASRHIEN